MANISHCHTTYTLCTVSRYEITKILEKPSSPQVTSRKSFSLQRQCSTSRCSKWNETVQLNKSFSVVVSPSGVIYYLNLIGDCKLKEHNTSLLDFDIICRSDKCIIHTEESLQSSHLIENKCSQICQQNPQYVQSYQKKRRSITIA